MDTPKIAPSDPPVPDPRISSYFLMEGPYDPIMVEGADSETQARDMCSIFHCREINEQHSNELWMSWRVVARFTPAEGRRVARKLGVIRLYHVPHPFTYVLKARRPWPRSPSP